MNKPAEATICAICAWREHCQKRFSRRGSLELHCPEFERDLTLPPEKKKREDPAGEEF